MKQVKNMLQDRISAVELEAMAKLDVDQAWMLNYVNTAYMVNISKNKDNLERLRLSMPIYLMCGVIPTLAVKLRMFFSPSMSLR